MTRKAGNNVTTQAMHRPCRARRQQPRRAIGPGSDRRPGLAPRRFSPLQNRANHRQDPSGWPRSSRRDVATTNKALKNSAGEGPCNID